MIDIHTHILPHMDDGAKDSATSLALLDMEMEQGIEELVFTPHYYGKSRSPKQFLDFRQDIFERMTPKLPQGIKTRLGAEVHFTGLNLPDYDEFCALAIQDTNAILIEFPFTAKWTSELTDKLADFIYETDYTPIIAHVERYGEVLKKPVLLTKLINMGCLLQVNVQSFLDKRERQFAFTLLKHGFVHCIGSDAHDTEERRPKWSEAKQQVAQAGFSQQWEEAQDIMQEILSGEQPHASMEKQIKKIFNKYY